jgi:predicted DNA-binding transcriptional regulator AlpA
MGSELITVEELAALWKVKESWIYQHMAEIPHLKLGALVRFDPVELEGFLLNSKRGPPGNGNHSK